MANPPEDLLKQAYEARQEKRLDDAKRHLVDAVDLCRKASIQRDLAKALTSLGQIERDLNHYPVAQRLYEEAVAIYRREDTSRLAHAVRHLGNIHRHTCDIELAEACYHEALELYRENPQTSPLELANAIRGLAILKGERGEAGQARQLWMEARDLYAAAEVQAGVDEASRRLACLSEKRGAGE